MPDSHPTTEQELVEWIRVQRARFKDRKDESIGGRGVIDLPTADSSGRNARIRIHGTSDAYKCQQQFLDLLDEILPSEQTAKLMHKYRPMSFNTVRELLLMMRVVEDRIEDSNRPALVTGNQADKQTDKQKINLTIPRDPDVLKLAQEINRQYDPDNPAKSKESIAREFTKGDNKKADRLLRQLRADRHGGLLDNPPDK